MKKILLLLALIVWPSLCWCDEYVLVMSKEKDVCQYMYNLYNDDLKKCGEIEYDKHKEFNAIKWVKKNYSYIYEGVRDYKTILMSSFDISNDGHGQIVLKFTNSIRNKETDSLYIFKKEDLEYTTTEISLRDLQRAAGKIGTGEAFKGGSYHLRELPPHLFEDVHGKYQDAYYTMWIPFRLKPFIFKGVYFIEIRDDLVYKDKVRFLVITRYARENQIQDICYYLRIPDCKDERQERK